jgi:peptidoglycan/xylan/chitin deacetylase (PgdA/CDA1 family)
MTTSWDDGHPLDFRVANLLVKYGLAGTFYVPRSAERSVLNRAQIHELSRSFEIGAHTLEHVYLDRISDTEAKKQLFGSRHWVQDVTGRECKVFCFPGGKFRKKHLSQLREAGFQAARTVELLSTEDPRRVNGLFLLPTTVQVYPHGRLTYLKNRLKRPFAASLWSSCAPLRTNDLVVLAKDALDRVTARGGVFHLWGHSWEIEEYQLWDRLEQIFSMIAARKRQFRAVTNGGLIPHAS